ncbi:S41 family peptidase [Ferrimonas sp. YFM]|uniref:S41 family peptidase n=1 Tax=Ferrimonas sp. YFM TaxID=3028878 RepID=UPI0025734F9B|nr:S41 family peptidase [Ferrimonas sp. YFM]
MNKKLARLMSRALILFLMLLFCLPAFASSTQKLSADAIDPLISQTLTVMREHYLNPDRVDDIESFLKARRNAGHYDQIATLDQFAQTLGQEIRRITGDAHVSLYVKQPQVQASHILSHPPGKLTHNYAFEQVSYLAGNIGYLKFNKFHPNPNAKEVADQALGFLSRADALIIDMRDTVGGSPDLARYLLSHFFKEGTELWRLYGRDLELLNVVNAEPVQLSRFQEKVPIVLLTSDDTASASELFASTMQAGGRAIVIGDTTGGAGYYAGVREVTDRLVLRLSLMKPVISANGLNWEGTGVTPDIKVPAMDAQDRAQLWLRTQMAPES